MDKVEVKKGDVIMFQANFEEAPNKINTARVTRVAKDKSWVDVFSFFGSKRIPNLGDNFKVVDY